MLACEFEIFAPLCTCVTVTLTPLVNSPQLDRASADIHIDGCSPLHCLVDPPPLRVVGLRLYTAASSFRLLGDADGACVDDIAPFARPQGGIDELLVLLAPSPVCACQRLACSHHHLRTEIVKTNLPLALVGKETRTSSSGGSPCHFSCGSSWALENAHRDGKLPLSSRHRRWCLWVLPLEGGMTGTRWSLCWLRSVSIRLSDLKNTSEVCMSLLQSSEQHNAWSDWLHMLTHTPLTPSPWRHPLEETNSSRLLWLQT